MRDRKGTSLVLTRSPTKTVASSASVLKRPHVQSDEAEGACAGNEAQSAGASDDIDHSIDGGVDDS